jgi:hypothetical protein
MVCAIRPILLRRLRFRANRIIDEAFIDAVRRRLDGRRHQPGPEETIAEEQQRGEATLFPTSPGDYDDGDLQGEDTYGRHSITLSAATW